ncbi:Hypothetical predicted protein [Marmota monax]|uniref:Uncharacterized protein n=1 Tax=Marmota monax TaxID=9995 RepID=A0A5E4B5H2_MARMO|nr:hypothetical protein GHT09_005776 [Marmota monax]VTJ64938.1 Hypothetical predicted protein [Marmota monax]
MWLELSVGGSDRQPLVLGPCKSRPGLLGGLEELMEGSLQVLMRQEDYPLDNPLSPTEMTPSLLPLLYQLYPERRYRGSDSSLWRIVYHIEASTGLPRGQSGGPWAALLPPHVGLCVLCSLSKHQS